MGLAGSTDISISTKMVGGSERVDFWLEQVSQLLIRVECSSKPIEGIDATLVHKDFALFRASEIAANQHAVVRTAQSIRDDGRDSVFVCLMKKGRGFTFQGVDCVMHVPGDLVLYDTARPYGHGFPGDMEMTVLDVPRAVFEQHVGPWHYRDLIKLDNGAGTAGWGAQSIHRLLAGMPGADARPRQQVASQVLELLRALLRINDGDLSTTRSTLSSLWRAKLHIERNLTDDALDCESISRAVGLSARQLARAFEIDGISITRYIWAQRLERCRADLLDRNLRHTAISEIAFRWGFNDSAHFSRSYRSRFGETPTATRGMLD